MQRSTNTHSYTSLRRDCGEIRLLELQPAESCVSPIRGRLIHVQLDEHPTYNAVSYMWGDTSTHHYIKIDDNKTFAITRTAHMALSDLRDEREVLLLWIDAVCINQQDIQERNHQVAIMRRIYAQAASVTIWLDHELDKGSVRRLNSLGAQASAADVGDDPALWEPIVAIAWLPYWYRAWVQQELAFAKCHVLQCRRTKIENRSWIQLKGLIDAKAQSAIEHGSVMEHRCWFSLSRAFSNTTALSSVGARLQPLQETLLSPAHRYETLLEALVFYRHLQATDARDKVYALLGFAGDVDLKTFRITYEATVAQVFTNVVIHVLEHSSSLNFLGACSLTCRQEDSVLPTWVPDWRAGVAYPITTIFRERERLINYHIKSRSLAHILSDNRTLSLQAMKVARITKIYRKKVPYRVLGEMTGPYLEDWAEMLGLDLKISPSSTSAENLECLTKKVKFIQYSKWEAFLRVLFARTVDDVDQSRTYKIDKWILYLGRVLPLALQAHLEKNSRLSEVLCKYDRDIWDLFCEAPSHLTLGQLIIVLDDGSFALGPADVALGDQVTLVQGCDLFMILRPIIDHYYEVVGPASIAGPYQRDPADVVRSWGMDVSFQEMQLR